MLHRDSQYAKDFANKMEQESQGEMFTGSANIDHPTVNVIKSKAQVSSHVGSVEGGVSSNQGSPGRGDKRPGQHVESMEAQDGEITKRTGVYVLDTNQIPFEGNLDAYHNSPIVHKALGARKPLKNNINMQLYESLPTGSVWKGS